MPLHNVVGILFGLLPAGRLKNWLLNLLPGWHVAASAHIAPVLIRRVHTLDIQADAFLAAGVCLNQLSRVSLAPESILGRFVYIASDPLLQDESDSDIAGTFTLGTGAALTGRHNVDCSGGVSIGAGTILAGLRTTILSHGIDLNDSVQLTDPVIIGENCFIGTCCAITKGVRIADRIAVGAGSVVVRSLDKSEHFFAGAPAREVRDLHGAKFFRRTEYFVKPQRRLRSVVKEMRSEIA